ncbi:hypothetical protein [Hymenobacter bucti]|uniref:Peptidase M48 domain-containing protein n=1 Tax=Hymenobacter bucti TaxID=1844114 RepID=A0ABW4QYN5_9BACT
MKGVWWHWSNKLLVGALGFVLTACPGNRTKEVPLQDRETQVLLQKSGARDYSLNNALAAALPGLNCISQARLGRHLVLAQPGATYDTQDTSVVLVIPYRPTDPKASAGVFSNVKERYVLLNPDYIRSWVLKNSLSGTNTALPDVLNLVLLHELGHFRLGRTGRFDEPVAAAPRTGQMEMQEVTPQYLTTDKRLELAVDSVAIGLVNQAARPGSPPACFSTAVTVQLLVPGANFNLAGHRTVDQFGSPHILYLPDYTSTHPNLELRLAFMAYYLHRTPEGRQQIDDYLYAREVAPIHRQEMDPRIFQGNGLKF